MKNTLKLLLLAVSLIAFCGAVSAQSNKQRLTREQLAEVQAKHIAKEMAMDDSDGRTLYRYVLPVPTGDMGTRSSPEATETPDDRRRNGAGIERAFRPQPENTGLAKEILCHLQRVPDAEANPAHLSVGEADDGAALQAWQGKTGERVIYNNLKIISYEKVNHGYADSRINGSIRFSTRQQPPAYDTPAAYRATHPEAR